MQLIRSGSDVHKRRDESVAESVRGDSGCFEKLLNFE